jgi:O-antigen/teichoic acid export membrane protein
MPVTSGIGPSRGRLLADASVTIVLRVANLLVTLALSIATARFLGAAGRGALITPMIDAGLVTTFFAGLASATAFFLLNENAGRGAIRGALIAALPFVAMGELVVLSMGILGRHLWATPFAAVALPCSALSLIAIGLANGTKRVQLAGAIGVAGSIVLLVMTVLGFAVAGSTPTVALWAWMLAQLCVAALSISVLIRIGDPLDQTAVDPRCVAGFAAKIGAVNVVTLLNYRADVYIVAFFTTPAVLGMYTLAVAGAEAALTATTAIATATAPHIGSLPPDRSRLLTARAARNTIFIAALSCALLAAIAPLLVRLLFGSSFVPLTGALRVLLIGIVATSANSVFASYFTLRSGRPGVALGIAAGSAAICIMLSIALVPRIGMIGAASATAVSYVLSALAFAMMFRRDSGVSLRQLLCPTVDDMRAYRDVAARGIEFLARWARRTPHALAAHFRR